MIHDTAESVRGRHVRNAHRGGLPGLADVLDRYARLLAQHEAGDWVHASALADSPADRPPCRDCEHRHPYGPCAYCSCICDRCGWNPISGLSAPEGCGGPICRHAADGPPPPLPDVEDRALTEHVPVARLRLVDHGR